MKDTYWIVLAFFLVAFIVAVIADWSGRRKVQRLYAENKLDKYLAEKERSIWNKNLRDTGTGRFFSNWILTPLIFFTGISDIVMQKARWKFFDYQGFDAVCIGIGVICLGLMVVSNPLSSAKNIRQQMILKSIFWLGVIGLITFFSLALFRNI